MYYKELIKRLKCETYWLGSDQPYSRDIHPVICNEAAIAITNLLARIEKVEKERDAAVNDIKHILKSLPYGDFCGLCAKAWDDCDEGETGICDPVWVGMRENNNDM